MPGAQYYSYRQDSSDYLHAHHISLFKTLMQEVGRDSSGVPLSFTCKTVQGGEARGQPHVGSVVCLHGEGGIGLVSFKMRPIVSRKEGVAGTGCTAIPGSMHRRP